MKYLIILCCLVLFGVNFLLYNRTQENNELKYRMEIQLANNKTLSQILDRNLRAEIGSDYMGLRDNIFLYEYRRGKKDSIPLFKMQNKCVLFIPNQSCSICYDEIYDVLLYAKDSLNFDIPIITEKEKFNEIRNIIQDLKYKINIYYLYDGFWKNIKIHYAPFFGYINPNMMFAHCFVPIANYPKYSYTYVQNIGERYHLVNIK